MKQNESKGKVQKLNLDDVPERGALGLLALGAVGLVAWRTKREEAKNAKLNPKSE